VVNLKIVNKCRGFALISYHNSGLSPEINGMQANRIHKEQRPNLQNVYSTDTHLSTYVKVCFVDCMSKQLETLGMTSRQTSNMRIARRV